VWGELVEAVLMLLAEAWPLDDDGNVRTLRLLAWVLLAIVAVAVIGYLLSS